MELELEFQEYGMEALDYMEGISLISIPYWGDEPPEVPEWMRSLKHIPFERIMEADLPANYDWLNGHSGYEASKD